MLILSPKTDFLGGSLVSASHLGQLFPGHLLTWKKKSDFLTVNSVEYEVLDPTNENFKYESIWCNDTCLDKGYQPGWDYNKELFEFLSRFKRVYIANHQPPNRYLGYLQKAIDTLYSGDTEEIIFMNYRACWNDEFKMYLGLIFPNVKVELLPYHYYIPYTLECRDEARAQDIVAIGRGNSKCKIQYMFNYLESRYGVKQLLPDNNISNYQFLKKLARHSIVLTGYYYGGEGHPEIDVPYNKLEWSFMDALLAGCIPVTNTLFSEELKRLNIPAPMLGYSNFQGIEELHKVIGNSPLANNQGVLINSINTLVNELDQGNKIIGRIIYEDITDI